MIERYETEAMRGLWDEEAKFTRWTKVEIAACEAFHERGEISDGDIEAIRKVIIKVLHVYPNTKRSPTTMSSRLFARWAKPLETQHVDTFTEA